MNKWDDMTNEELVVMWQKNKDEQLFEYFLERNKPIMIRFLATRLKKHRGRSDEMFQIGRVAMWRAMKTFDIKKGYKFTTYYPWSIKREMNYFDRGNHLVRLPAYVIEHFGKFIENPDGRIMGVSSLDMPRTNEDGKQSGSIGDNVVDMSPNPIEQFEAQEENANVKPLLSHLSPRQQYVMEMRLGLDRGYGRTLDEVGKIVGVTRERIRQIEAKALKRLKQYAPMYYDLADTGPVSSRALKERDKKHTKTDMYLAKYNPIHARKIIKFIDRSNDIVKTLFKLRTEEITMSDAMEELNRTEKTINRYQLELTGRINKLIHKEN